MKGYYQKDFSTSPATVTCSLPGGGGLTAIIYRPSAVEKGDTDDSSFGGITFCLATGDLSWFRDSDAEQTSSVEIALVHFSL